MNTYWYILRVFPGKERQITDEFNERISSGRITNIKRFICPTEKEMVVVRKKKILRDKVIYSGYVYFECNEKLNEDDLKHISFYENVMVMSGGSKIPILMRQNDVDKIIKDSELEDRVRYQTEGLKIKDKVEITEGPFKGFTGEVTEIFNERISLDVSVFGRPTKVVLNNEQIKKY